MATLLFACVPSAMDELQKENLADRAFLAGDPMYDAFKYYRETGKTEKPNAVMTIDGDQVLCAGPVLLPHLSPGGKHTGRYGAFASAAGHGEP